MLENTNLVTLSHSRSRFLCLFIKILQFLFILKLPINFFSVNGHECYKIINLVSSFLLKLKFILSLFLKSRKYIIWKLFCPKNVKALNLFRSLHFLASQKSGSLERQLKFNVNLSLNLVFLFTFYLIVFP